MPSQDMSEPSPNITNQEPSPESFTPNMGRDQESRQRALGSQPSWPARMPATFERRFNSARGHAKTTENAELLGRLTQLADSSWHWAPTPAQAKLGACDVSWDASWTVQIEKLWGPWNQGMISYSKLGEQPFNLWIHGPSDVQKHVARPRTEY